LSLIEILRSAVERISLDKARHFAWFVSRYKPNNTAFVRHLDKFALQGPLDNLEQVFSKLFAGNRQDFSVHPKSGDGGRYAEARKVSRRLLYILSTVRLMGCSLSAFAVLVSLTGASGQTAAQTEPRFEVASIKPSPPPAGGTTVYNPTRERFAADNITTRTLIALAWDVRVFQVSGGPGWLDSQRYDVVAKPDGEPEDKRIRQMVRTFLAERFQLEVHHASKEMPVFTLEIAKGGSKIQTASPGDGPEIRDHNGHLTARRVTAEMLARILANELERPVLNRTGIESTFDIDLAWTPEQDTDPGPSIFTAIQEQPGLKLESKRAPVDVLIVDRVERPSAN
jgi:uncharacterized protein (TIGR03435 family)